MKQTVRIEEAHVALGPLANAGNGGLRAYKARQGKV